MKEYILQKAGKFNFFSFVFNQKQVIPSIRFSCSQANIKVGFEE